MARVVLEIVESRCRGGLHRVGERFEIGDICPPICHELWQCIYPLVFALHNGADLDCGDGRARRFESRCPDGGRVLVRGEVMSDGAGGH